MWRTLGNSVVYILIIIIGRRFIVLIEIREWVKCPLKGVYSERKKRREHRQTENLIKTEVDLGEGCIWIFYLVLSPPFQRAPCKHILTLKLQKRSILRIRYSSVCSWGDGPLLNSFAWSYLEEDELHIVGRSGRLDCRGTINNWLLGEDSLYVVVPFPFLKSWEFITSEERSGWGICPIYL